ncbi:uncharacterized protein LOC127957056 [Carassius gibelio]|uniref:uncharacterized protein LOC127957056 n=1 Tax=Carassius gibelio TaxID=101364 RepID=UPI002278423D|nr:uncharacterized protein LOC127957056 [Carassius gibelio]
MSFEDRPRLKVALGVYLYQAVLVERAASFQLVLCVQAATQPKSAFSSVAPAVISLPVTLGHLMPITMDFELALFLPGYCMTWCSIPVGNWLTECTEGFLKDLSKQSRGSENHMEAKCGASLFMEQLATLKFREVGQVYVYLQRKGFSFSSRPNQILTGTCLWVFWQCYSPFGRHRS